MSSDLASIRRAKITLRVAAGVATLQALAHIVLFARSQPSRGSAVWPLEQAMRAQTAPGHANYWGMYFGYGLLAAITAFFTAALIWVLTGFDAKSARLARQTTTVIAATLAAHAVVVAQYFFVIPLVFDLIVIGLLLLSWFALRNVERD